MWVIKQNGGSFLKYGNGYLEGVSLSLGDISDAGTCASLDAGTGAGDVLLLSVANTLPALNGSNLTALGSVSTHSDVVLSDPQPGNFLVYDGEDWINTILSSDAVTANVTPVNYAALNTDTLSTHLSAIDAVLATSGGLEFSRKAIGFTAEVGFHYSVSTAGGAVVVALPALSTLTAGDIVRFYFRERVGTNNLEINVAGGSGDTINGAGSFTLDVQYDSITIIANPTDNLWEVV